MTQSRPVDVVDRLAVPDTVSPQAAPVLRGFYEMVAAFPAFEPARSEADWDARHALYEAAAQPLAQQAANAAGVTVVEDVLGQVPVLRVRSDAPATGRLILYVHGGSFTYLSARSTLTVPALVAAAGGDEVISIDYTVAPRGRWQSVTAEVLSVWKALIAAGHDPARIGLMGDSAGGSIVAGSALRMRDEGLPLPGALFLLSPWADLTNGGDTYATLAAADPVLTAESLIPAAEAYVPAEDWSHPYVSAVHGDFSRPYPPTLIQAGTREIFLSHAVRLYQAITGGGRHAVLDVYEGMPHVFHALAPQAPETATAIGRAVAFFRTHLG